MTDNTVIMTLLLLYAGAGAVERLRAATTRLEDSPRWGWGKSMHHCVVRAWQADHANQPKTHPQIASTARHAPNSSVFAIGPSARRSRGRGPSPSSILVRPDPHSPVRHPVTDSSVLCKKKKWGGSTRSLYCCCTVRYIQYTHSPAPCPCNPRLGNLDRATTTAKKPCVLDHPTNQVPGEVP